MQLEVKHFLKRTLNFNAQFEVMRTPSYVEADFASNVAFIMQKKEGKFETLEEQASSILDCLSKVSQDYFEFSLSEKGHVNISVLEPAKTKFINTFSENVYKNTSLLFNEEMESLAEFKHSKEDLLLKAKKSEDSQNSSFEPTSPSDYLMLLAALSDPEIDLSFYQKGLSGKQNIPWYVSRFRADALSFMKKLKKAGNGRFVNRPYDIATISVGAIHESPACVSSRNENLFNHKYFHCAFELIFSVRAAYAKMILTKTPEPFVKHLLDSMDAFYFYYNRPNVRSLDVDNPQQLRLLTKSLFSLVDLGFKTIEIGE